MAEQITIPVFGEPKDDGTIGGPATVVEKIKDATGSVITNLILDESTLRQSTDSALLLISFIQNHLTSNKSKVELETFTVELGVSLTGKVGFGGSGVDTELGTVFQITFKVN